MTLVQKIKYKTYSAYKDSGVKWLGNIPFSWKFFRMKRLYKDFSKKNCPEAELLSVTQGQGVVPRTWVENRMVMPSSALESFKFIEKGDFAISLRSFEGGLEYCYHDGIISPAYTVLKNRRDDLKERFYKYLFKSHAFISELQTSVVGIREGKNISYPELSYSYLPIPPLSEQTAIASFLDRKTALIDKAITNKEKLIALLKERKQILIQNAVTGKIVWSEKEQKFVPIAQSEIKSKDSGVEWIGEIPEGWEVKRLKYLSIISSGEAITNSELKDEGFYEVFGGNGLMGYADKFNVEGDKLIIGRVGALCGNVRYSERKRWISDNALIMTLKATERYDYLAVVLEAANLKTLNTSNAQPLITGSKVMNFFIPYPPQKEQSNILSYIETQSAKIDKAIALQQTQIEKLKEYKATLIDSAVTGKIKV